MRNQVNHAVANPRGNRPQDQAKKWGKDHSNKLIHETNCRQSTKESE